MLACIDDATRRLVLGNGHPSPDETRTMLDAIDEMGVDTTLLVTHADSAFMRLSTADQVELAARGAVVEKCLLPAEKWDVTVVEAAESINRIGAEHCVLSTDFGQPLNASPPTAYRSFVASLREHGVSAHDLESMCRENPVALIGEPLPDDAR